MNKWKAKLRTKSFWVTIVGVLTLLLTHLGVADASAVAEGVARAVGALLVLSGVIAAPAAPETQAPLQDAEEKDKEEQ